MKKNPLKEALRWLETLEWDGHDRLSTWLTECLGAADTPQVQSIGRQWLQQAVNRLINPGSIGDFVLVLDGPQGLGKSSALRVLAGPWFSDAPLDLRSKDAFLSINGSWIHELAEIEALAKPEATLMKTFITQRQDSYRPPYAAHIVTQPRQTVFAATTNDFAGAHYLRQSRHFLPVQCTNVRLPLIHAIRDQLFAQALHEITPCQSGHLAIPQSHAASAINP